MTQPKYPPEEIDRMIDEEISRIDAANAAAGFRDNPPACSLLRRIFRTFRLPTCRPKRQNNLKP